MSALLEVDGVSRLYSSGSLLARRQIAAVDGVSLRLDEGKPEIVTVIGESGSGKTTLARMVLNMVPPSSGAIRFRGTDLRGVRGTRAGRCRGSGLRRCWVAPC